MKVKNLMSKAAFLASALCLPWTAQSITAQTDDPVIMVINGEPVLRSEFEYSYNKNNTEGVIDKKTVEEYVELFVNYKLKVVAAIDAHLDTLKSFKKEFAMYRNQQIMPSFVTDEGIDAEARRIYQNTKDAIGPKGLILPYHILVAVEQDASQEEQDAAKQRIDSIYNALQAGADFEETAKACSQDPGSSFRGGKLPWLSVGQTMKEFEEAAFALDSGEMSLPVQSPAGWHIIQMRGRKQLEPYDSLKASVIKFMEARGGRDRVANAAIDTIISQSGGTLTREDVLDKRAEEMQAEDMDLDYLVREYHDGLLLYEISTREVWDKAAKDSEGLAAYFKKNKKKYNWDKPRYKGMVYHTRAEEDLQAVKDCVKGVDFAAWGDKLRRTFNADTVMRIKVQKGIFKQGDNAFIDKMVFGKDTIAAPVKNYPYDDVYGKILKKGPETYEDVKGLVTADYQEVLEKQWVAELRKRYAVTVYDDIVATVNKKE